MLRVGISCLGNLSLLSTCTQISLIVTQRLHIFDIDRQLTMFSVTQLSPIITHANMYANRFYRHIISLYCRHRQATNFFRLQTTIPYYRSCEHARKTLVSSHNVSLLSTSTGNPTIFSVTQRSPIIAHLDMHANRCYRHTTSSNYRHRQATNYSQRHTTFPYYRSREHPRLFRHTTTSYHRSHHHEVLHQQAINYFRRQTLFPIIAHVNIHANKLFRHTHSPYYRSRQHEALHSQASN